jgi:hypothetical protein
MKQHEILPKPEAKNPREHLDRVDGYNEVEEDMAPEKILRAPHGSTALSGVAVDDANNQLQAAQLASNLGATAGSSLDIEVPDEAGDIDLIEKIWVQKAKDIVMNTQGDPYAQNKQLNHMKVEYIKKRYDKDIRSSEER